MNIGAMAADKQFPDGNTRIFIGSRVRGEQYPLADPSRVLIFSSEGKYLGDETLPGIPDHMKAEGLIASIRDRLLNLSRENGEAFDFVLARYGVERFL